jgi:general secretion pathway protein G
MFKQRNGFTLIELVVVILILGILAGVGAPKLFTTSGIATENGLKQTLSIVRDGIELYAADNGGDFPNPADSAAFHTAMENYVRGKFPVSPVGNQNNDVKIVSGASTTADGLLTGWIYNTTTGEFICNCTETTKSDINVTYDEL